jgi:hypothetical protein
VNYTITGNTSVYIGDNNNIINVNKCYNILFVYEKIAILTSAFDTQM